MTQAGNRKTTGKVQEPIPIDIGDPCAARRLPKHGEFLADKGDIAGFHLPQALRQLAGFGARDSFMVSERSESNHDDILAYAKGGSFQDPGLNWALRAP